MSRRLALRARRATVFLRVVSTRSAVSPRCLFPRLLAAGQREPVRYRAVSGTGRHSGKSADIRGAMPGPGSPHGFMGLGRRKNANEAGF